jgi:transposase InsO family protein
MGRGNRYTLEEKRNALKLAEEVGASEAARRLGMPAGTVSQWRWSQRKAAQEGKDWPARVEPRDRDVDEAPEPSSGKPVTAGATPKRTARVYTPSQRSEALELAAKVGVSAASRKLGMGRFTIYQWRRKAKLAAEGLADSPTSGPDPAEVDAQRDKEILNAWQEHPGLGPSQVRNQLRRKSIKVSTATVRRVMEEAGYRSPKAPKRSKHTRRYEAVRPNHLWHLDFVQRWIGRASTFTLIVIDDHSRFVVGHGVDDAERADLVIATFEAAVSRYGRPEMVVHDKGAAFWSWKGMSRFSRLLEEMDVEQIPATKQTNGKVEAFNGNLHKELFDAVRFFDVGEMKRRLQSHIHWYNHRRTHHALGGLLVPADRYYGRVDEVLARIEAGAGADDSDPLALRDRLLELFKVVSSGGKTEVWLMGHQIFG